MSKTLIFIDWDDTLFPTNWIHESMINIAEPTADTILLFGELDKLITDMILNMIFVSKVLIVTNGTHGWVCQCLHVLPNFKQIIGDDTVSITSARDLFSQDYGREDWKRMAFKMFFNEHKPNNETFKIISFGDSDDEHNAVTELANHNSDNQKRIIGSVKFIKDPSLNQLILQLQTVKQLHKDIIDIATDHIIDLEQFIL